MNRFVKSLAFVLVLVMCIGMFTACGDDTNGTESTKPSGTNPTGTTAPEVEKDLAGIVMEVSDTFIVLDLCMESLRAIDYLELKAEDLKGTGEMDYVYVNSSAVYGHVADGELVVLKNATLKVGDIVVVTRSGKDLQQFVILNYKTEDTTPSKPTDPSTPAN